MQGTRTERVDGLIRNTSSGIGGVAPLHGSILRVFKLGLHDCHSYTCHTFTMSRAKSWHGLPGGVVLARVEYIATRRTFALRAGSVPIISRRLM